jgi:hypothetical protein
VVVEVHLETLSVHRLRVLKMCKWSVPLNETHFCNMVETSAAQSENDIIISCLDVLDVRTRPSYS